MVKLFARLRNDAGGFTRPTDNTEDLKVAFPMRFVSTTDTIATTEASSIYRYICMLLTLLVHMFFFFFFFFYFFGRRSVYEQNCMLSQRKTLARWSSPHYLSLAGRIPGNTGNPRFPKFYSKGKAIIIRNLSTQRCFLPIDGFNSKSNSLVYDNSLGSLRSA